MNRIATALLTYDRKGAYGNHSPPVLWGPVLLMSAMVVTLFIMPPAVGSIVFGAAALHALRGQRQILEAFTILFLVLMSNPVLHPAYSGPLRWVVISAGFGRVLWDGFFNASAIRVPFKAFAMLLAFFVWAAVGAGLSTVPTLSVLKLTSFGVAVITIFVAFSSTVHLAEYWRSWLHTFFLFVLVASLPMLLIGFGYVRTTQGFQGIFSHPQVLGPMAGLAGAWFLGIFVASDRRLEPAVVIGVALSCILLLLSAARTGAVALGGGLFITILMLGFSRLQTGSWNAIKGGRVWVFAVLIVTGLVVGGGTAVTTVTDFILKDSDPTSSFGELFEETRGGLAARSLDNFYDSPIAGIGFGVPSDLARTSDMELVMGIPVSASTEKGFMPTAILEEVGLVGAFLIILFMWMVSRDIIRWGDIVVSWLYWSSLLVNIGSAVFFSVGGVGFFIWMMIGFCYSQAESMHRAAVASSADTL